MVRLPAVAPFNVCVYKDTDKAGDCWPMFRDYTGWRLYQVQIAHEARPSIVFNLRNSFEECLKEQSTDQPGYPISIAALADESGIKLVITDNNDPDHVGFVTSVT